MVFFTINTALCKNRVLQFEFKKNPPNYYVCLVIDRFLSVRLWKQNRSIKTDFSFTDFYFGCVARHMCQRWPLCPLPRVDCCTGADIRDMSGILIRVFSSCLTTYYLFLLLPPPSQPSTLSLKARHTTAFWWPLYSLLISPVSTHHRRARLSEEAVEWVKK